MSAKRFKLAKRVACSPPGLLQDLKKPTMAPKKLADPHSEGSRVIIETYGINDGKFFGTLSDEELIFVWEKVLGRSTSEIFGMKTKRSIDRHFRAIFVLNTRLEIGQITQKEVFVYRRKKSDAKTEEDFDNIHCRLIGFDKVRPAEIGQLVRVTASTVDFTICPKDIIDWLAKFGSVNSNFEYVKNSVGIRSDVIETEIKLKTQIPEYLPVAGKKVLINYPGIKRMCINCYRAGHMKRNCKARRVEWIAKVEEMRKSGLYEDKLFGEWAEILDSAADPRDQATPMQQ